MQKCPDFDSIYHVRMFLVDRFVELAPSNGEAHLRLGEALFELNKYPKALEALFLAETTLGKQRAQACTHIAAREHLCICVRARVLFTGGKGNDQRC